MAKHIFVAPPANYSSAAQVRTLGHRNRARIHIYKWRVRNSLLGRPIGRHRDTDRPADTLAHVLAPYREVPR